MNQQASSTHEEVAVADSDIAMTAQDATDDPEDSSAVAKGIKEPNKAWYYFQGDAIAQGLNLVSSMKFELIPLFCTHSFKAKLTLGISLAFVR